MFHATNWETNNCNTLIAQWPNVSRDKGNQKMEFGHLKEYNTRNIFLKKSYTKYGGKTSLRRFKKKSKLSISLFRSTA